MSLPYLQPYLGLSNGLNTLHAAGGGAGGVGGWVELGRTTLGSAGDQIDVSSISDKRYYMVLSDTIASGTSITTSFRVGNSTIDTGTNYAWRTSNNGGADGTITSTVGWTEGGNTSQNNFTVGYMANLSGNEKLWQHHAVVQTGTGATNVPNRYERVGKWTNTSNPMDIFRAQNVDTADYTSGSEVVVLGWDPADTHTNNFWEELASVELGSANATIDTGTFTAKKYLWFQIYITGSSVNNLLHIRMNNLSTGIYADRYSHNGGTDSTDVSSGSARLSNNNDTLPKFLSGFMINNTSNEKLGICHEVSQNTAGAANAPNRTESVFKIANTSVQATSLQIINLSGTWNSGSIIKVWGAD